MSELGAEKIYLGSDIDDVIADTDAAFRELLSCLVGYPIPKSDITDFRYENCLPVCPDDAWSVIYTVLNQPDMIAPISGAADAIRRLSSLCDICLFTGRADEFRAATVAWLQQHEILYDDIVFEKQTTSRWMDMDFFVEDDPEFAQRLASHGIRVFLFDAPWNRQVCQSPLIERVGGWEELTERIQSYMHMRCIS